MIFAQKNQILQLMPETRSVGLNLAIRQDDDFDYKYCSRKIHELEFQNEVDFLFFIFSRVFLKMHKIDFISYFDLNRIYKAKYSRKIKKIQLPKPRKWKERQEKLTPQVQSGSKNPHFDLFFENRSDPNGVSDLRVKTPQERYFRLAKWIQEKKVEFGLWISKLPRDHNINPHGRLDPASTLYQKLIKRYQCDFGNGSFFSTFIPAIRGLSFTMQMNKTGYIRIWLDETVGRDDFTKHFFKEFDFLDFDEQTELLQCFELNNKNIFILETANTCGPENVITQNFKGSLVVVKRLYYRGKLEDIEVYVDYSKGKPEIEFKGLEGPCRRLQAIVTRSVEVAQTFGFIESVLEQFLGSFELTDKKIDDITNKFDLIIRENKEIKQEINTNYKKIISNIDDSKESLIHNQNQNYSNTMKIIENSTDAINERLDSNFEEISAANKYISEHIQESNQNFIDLSTQINQNQNENRINFGRVASQTGILIQSVTKHTDSLNSQFEENFKCLSDLSEKVEWFETEHQNSIQSAKSEIKTHIDNKINQIDKKLENNLNSLQKAIELRIDSINEQFKNNLYLVLRAIAETPGQTAIALHNELNMSKSTLYNYLSILRESNIVEAQKQQLLKNHPGRKRLKFRIKRECKWKNMRNLN